MTPVEWKDGWPLINPGYEEVQYHYPVPFPKQTKKITNSFSGNFLFKDDFNTGQLNYRWELLRTPEENWYNLSEKSGALTMSLLPQTCSGKEVPAFLGFRQSHLSGYATTSINFKARSANEKAGLLIFQNEPHFYFLCQSIQNDTTVVQLYRSVANDKDGRMELLQSQSLSELKNDLELKIEAKRNFYAFWYSTKKGKWILLKDNVDAKFLSTKIAGGFVGSMYALYGTSLGEKTNNKVYFNWFESKSEDELYK
jgi:alpha-N-arabinofuranosidase